MKQYDYIIVGAGITGVTAASILAREQDKKVLLVEKRDHIGGNCYDYYDEHGILIHKYGPHILHTQYKDVWEFLSQFTEWIPYRHRVKAWIDGMLVTIPINIKTMEDLLGRSFTPKQMQQWVDKDRIEILTPTNAEEMVLSCMGKTIYEKFFKNYTKKQWGIDARELAPEVTARVPIRFNKDDRYFEDPYQGIPKDGFNKMFERILECKNIDTLLNTDYKEIIESLAFDQIIYTGPVDYFFDYQFGPLPYRGLKFIFKTLERKKRQPVAVVNYPNNFTYTRITEFKHMTMQEHPRTTLCYEYPDNCIPGKNNIVPSYPIPAKETTELYKKYKQQADKLKSVTFVGRLAEYKYYNMDGCIKAVMDYLKKGPGNCFNI